jgi:ribosomal protein S18 acetylase RimI-like enzyme
MIRKARDRDLPELKRIIVEAFGQSTMHYLLERRFGPIGGRSWDLRKADEIETFYRSHPENVLVTEKKGRILGFISFSLDQERKIGKIGNNAVAPEHQNRGIGTEQIVKTMGILKERGMKVVEVQTGLTEEYGPARHMYEKCGFEPTMEFLTYHASLD